MYIDNNNIIFKEKYYLKNNTKKTETSIYPGQTKQHVSNSRITCSMNKEKKKDYKKWGKQEKQKISIITTSNGRRRNELEAVIHVPF